MDSRAAFIAFHHEIILERKAWEVFEHFEAEKQERILAPPSALACIQRLAGLGVLVTSISFWCDCTPDNARRYGCPHGGGGYAHSRGGYYSECYHLDAYDLEERGLSLAVRPAEYRRVVDQGNALMIRYLTHGFPQERFYSPCLYLGLAFPD